MRETTLAPSPNLVDAAIVWRAEPRDVLNILWLHQDGMQPEEIVRRLPSLDLADVYAVIACSLRCPTQTEEYLRLVKEIGERTHAELGGLYADRYDPMARTRARQAPMQKGERGGYGQANAHRCRCSGPLPLRRSNDDSGNVSGWLQRAQSRLRNVASCVAALKRFMSEALLLLTRLQSLLNELGVKL